MHRAASRGCRRSGWAFPSNAVLLYLCCFATRASSQLPTVDENKPRTSGTYRKPLPRVCIWIRCGDRFSFLFDCERILLLWPNLIISFHCLLCEQRFVGDFSDRSRMVAWPLDSRPTKANKSQVRALSLYFAVRVLLFCIQGCGVCFIKSFLLDYLPGHMAFSRCGL